MPNIKSAKKRVKVTTAKTLRNKMYKSSLKTAIRKFKTAVAAGDKSAAAASYTDAVSMVDKAVTKGILHANNAARKKSSFTAMLNSLS
ncbi:MAG: 30S ribosomal protein S20 [Candidatus Izemoplasmatales bacterium]